MSPVGNPSGGKQKAGSNVYTSMALIAVLALGAAVGAVWWKNVDLSHDEQPKDRNFTNPFFMLDQPPKKD